MKYMLQGPGRCGKETVGKIMNQYFGLTCIASSLAASESVIFPLLKKTYGYATAKECYEDRLNHRQEWKEIISRYNKDDPCKLGDYIYENYDAYDGCRSRREFDAICAKWQPVTIWIDSSMRKPNLEDPTLEMDMFDCSYYIDNNSTEERLNFEVINLLRRTLMVPFVSHTENAEPEIT